MCKALYAPRHKNHECPKSLGEETQDTYFKVGFSVKVKLDNLCGKCANVLFGLPCDSCGTHAIEEALHVLNRPDLIDDKIISIDNMGFIHTETTENKIKNDTTR